MNSTIRVRPGLLKRMREIHRLGSEEAQAHLMGVSISTIRRIGNGAQPSGDFMVALCETFGLNLGEAFEIVPKGSDLDPKT